MAELVKSRLSVASAKIRQYLFLRENGFPRVSKRTFASLDMVCWYERPLSLVLAEKFILTQNSFLGDGTGPIAGGLQIVSDQGPPSTWPRWQLTSLVSQVPSFKTVVTRGVCV